MSRIGKLPIKVPKNVSVTLEKNHIEIKGPNGSLNKPIPKEIGIDLVEDTINVYKNVDTRIARQKHGLMRSLVNNMVKGTSTKFEKKLQMIGVGYRAQVQGKQLTLSVGFSHPVLFDIPEGIEIVVEANTNLIIKGIDKEQVGLLSSKIRAVRPPEPYKGKGIKYSNEVILRKAGKSGK